MGSSDRICAVSHLPILYKEPCRFIFLRQVIAWDDDMEPGSWQHVWTRWLPLGLPVKGLYAGYGRVMAGYHETIPEGHDSHHALYDPEDPLTKFQVESIARVVEPLPDKEGWGELLKFPHTIESLMVACERGWLRVKLPRTRLRDGEEQKFATLRVSPYYVSERAWQAMVAAPDDGGIGIWRPRTKKFMQDSEEKLLMVGALKATIDHYRDWPERREHLKEVLEKTKESPEEVQDTLSLLERCFPLTMRELGPEHEEMPDMLAIGGDWEPDLSGMKSLYDFGDDDWRRMDELAFDLRVFAATFRFELFRHIHPELHSLQFHPPENSLDGHRMLAVYIQQWCQDIEDDYEREEREWEEKQAAKEKGDG
jgi:hypothetical protein